MPKYEYFLIEKTVVTVEIEAKDQDEANNMVEDMLDTGDIDWGIGGMETGYEFNGEIKNA
jgi:hypothetical protein